MLYRLSYVGGASSDFICYIVSAQIMPTVDEVLDNARRRLKRVTAEQAAGLPVSR